MNLPAIANSPLLKLWRGRPLEPLIRRCSRKPPRLTYVAPDPATFAPDDKKRPPTAKQIADAEKSRQEATVDVAFEAYGECVVRENPVTAKQLLASLVSSDSEASAFGLLMPSFSDCLPKNQQFTATKAMLQRHCRARILPAHQSYSVAALKSASTQSCRRLPTHCRLGSAS